MARRNSVESLLDDSSVSSDSIDGSDEESDEDLITVLKKQTFLKPKKPLAIEPWCKKISDESRKGGLCSIPEDGVQCSRVSFALEEEPMGHRSPVSLENGYKPHSKETLDLHEVPLLNDVDIDESPTKAFSWSFLALLSYLLRYLMIFLCICTLFIVFVILTHQHSRYKQRRYFFCLSLD